MKTCAKCGETKQLDQFHKRKASPDGRKPRCKTCILAEARSYRNRSDVKENRAEYGSEYRRRPEVRERRAEYRKEYYSKPENSERRRNYLSDYYRANREHLAAQQADYYRKNRDWLLANYRKWYAENREYVRAYHAEYHRANPQTQWAAKFRLRARAYGFEHLIPSMESFTREDLVERYGDACFHCGGAWSQLDHFPVPVVKGGEHILDNCVPSCATCNQRSWLGERGRE